MAVTDVDLSVHEPHVKRWLAKGFAGDMGYLHRNLEKRLHPELLETETCRVISARMNYLPPDTQPLEVLANSKLAYVSRYALGRDYHKILRKRLATLAAQIDESLPGHRYRAFTDSAPVLEKALAEKAGLGWMGKHTLLLHEDVGSWFFLGEIYTNAPITCTTQTVTDACGKCSACITVCPTQAIVGPKMLDARRCISYLTIEHRAAIPDHLRPLLGRWVFGCDDCQEVCPHNGKKLPVSADDFRPRTGHAWLDLEWVLSSEDERLSEHFVGSPIRRCKPTGLKRNAAIVRGNLGDAAARPALLQAHQHPDAVVRDAAKWALDRV